MLSKTAKYIELIDAIVKRPAMFGINRVEDIYLITDGYLWAQSKDNDRFGRFLTAFRAFVNKECEDISNDQDWARLIRFYSGSDYHSIELFNRYFSEFVKTKKAKSYLR